MDASTRERLARNLAAVRARIGGAAERARRDPAEVRLVAVTKSVDEDLARGLLDLGQLDLAENRIDALAEKRAALPSAARWHMIGHLQRNKVKRFLGTGALLHALDSARLCDALAESLRKERLEEPLAVLVEVNVSGEAQKGGVPPEGLLPLLERARASEVLEPSGLMTMAPFDPDPEHARPHFRALRTLRDRARERFPHLEELSMGMSQDFEVAVEEGASMVRVGSALFLDLVSGTPVGGGG